MFLERLSVFDYENNKYYKPEGEFNLNNASNDLAIPNCTTYAFLRMQEASEQEERQSTWIRASGGYGHAKTWYDTTTLPKGSEIRTGAVAVFDGNCGHVAFVERKIDDTHAYLTESNYSANKNLRDWHFFNKRPEVELVVGKATIKGCGPLLGFIYVPIKDKRVSRNTSVNQVLVNSDMVNVRDDANGNIKCKGLYCPAGIYNIKSIKVEDDYKWYELDDNCWIREGDWTVEYPAKEEIDYKSLYLEAQAKLDKIKDIIK